jgi:translation elongation factor EF-1beta
MYVVERDDTINWDRTIRFFNKKENAEKLFKKLKEEALEEYGEYRMEESEWYFYVDDIYLYIEMFEAQCEDDEVKDLLDS